MRVRSWRPWVVWGLCALLGWGALIPVVEGLSGFLELAALPLVAAAVVGAFWRLSQLGFIVSDSGVRIVGYLRTRRVARADVVGFGPVTRAMTLRLAVLTHGGPILLPVGEDEAVPVEDLARELTALYRGLDERA